MNRVEHLFECLGEEGSEVSQRTSKINRFGILEVQPGQEKNNAERLLDEIGDLLGVYEMLVEEGVLPDTNFGPRIDAKKIKVEKFLLYSREQGTLTDG